MSAVFFLFAFRFSSSYLRLSLAAHICTCFSGRVSFVVCHMSPVFTPTSSKLEFPDIAYSALLSLSSVLVCSLLDVRGLFLLLAVAFILGCSGCLVHIRGVVGSVVRV